MVYTLLADDLRRDYVKSVSPIGANPFELAVAYKTTVGFSDLDYNIHLSNSSYAKVNLLSYLLSPVQSGSAAPSPCRRLRSAFHVLGSEFDADCGICFVGFSSPRFWILPACGPF